MTQCGFMRHPARIAERIGCLDIFRFLVNVVIEEMKKYTVLKLLNQNKVIHKDLIGLVTKEIIRYAKDYHIYQRKSLVRK